MDAILRLSKIYLHPVVEGLVTAPLSEEILDSMSESLQKDSKYAGIFSLFFLVNQDPNANRFVPYINDDEVFDLRKQQHTFPASLKISGSFKDRIRRATGKAFNPYDVQNSYNYLSMYHDSYAPLYLLKELGLHEGYQYVMKKAENPEKCIYRMKALIINPDASFENRCSLEEDNELYNRLYTMLSAARGIRLDVEEVRTWIESFMRLEFQYKAREGLYWAVRLLDILQASYSISNTDISHILDSLLSNYDFATVPMQELQHLRSSFSKSLRKRITEYKISKLANSTFIRTKLLQWQVAIWNEINHLENADCIQLDSKSHSWQSFEKLDAVALINDLDQIFSSVLDLSGAMMSIPKLKIMQQFLHLSSLHLYHFGYIPERYYYNWCSIIPNHDVQEIVPGSLVEIDDLFNIEMQRFFEGISAWIFNVKEFEQFYCSDSGSHVMEPVD